MAMIHPAARTASMPLGQFVAEKIQTFVKQRQHVKGIMQIVLMQILFLIIQHVLKGDKLEL